MIDATSGVKLTYEDFLLFPDDGQRHELIDGEHYVTPCPNTGHQRIAGHLYFRLRGYLETHRIGELFFAPFDIVFTNFDVVEPDLLYMSNERAQSILTDKNVQGSPELVIEIASPSTRRRDDTIKRRLYERMDVAEYWMVDPESESVHIFRREGDGFAGALELSRERGDLLTSPLFPQLELALDDIFAA